MTIHKDCADHLRQNYLEATGNKMSSGHAHEIVAAYFGYPTGSALRVEDTYPLDNLPTASIIVPDLVRIEERLANLDGFPSDAGTADGLASQISVFLIEEELITGEVWDTRDLKEYIASEFVSENSLRIMDALSSEMAVTNAFFDGPHVEDVEISDGLNGLGVSVEGILEGDSDPDKVFYGDTINFSSYITFDRVAGRIAYAKPDWETTGEVDQSHYE